MSVPKLKLGSIASLLTTELNSLANAAGAVAGSAYNNTQGGGAGDGYPYAEVELNLGSPGGTVAGSISVYFLLTPDGTNQEDGSSSVQPARPADVVFPLRGVSTAQRLTRKGVVLPPGNWKALLWNASGQALNASGNTLKILPYTVENV